MNDDRNESGLPAGRACENWRGPLTRYMDDEMSDEKRTAVERHLELCEACRREVELCNAARAQWSGILSLDSTPEVRSAIMDAAREDAAREDIRKREAIVWQRLRSWSMPLRRIWALGDLVTGAAIALSIFMAVQFKPWRKAAGPTAGWASSTPAVFYGQTASRKQRDPAADP
ncbi:MAG: zf-HC2 domain-containing protein, partial [Candidatus Krumholzibacteria bacterium]|nr:zf-HC2 domain-containing protein [Candidatus Krumholzibacteria bacterium]